MNHCDICKTESKKKYTFLHLKLCRGCFKHYITEKGRELKQSLLKLELLVTQLE